MNPLRFCPVYCMPNSDQVTDSPGVTVSTGPAGCATIPVRVTASAPSGPRSVVPVSLVGLFQSRSSRRIVGR